MEDSMSQIFFRIDHQAGDQQDIRIWVQQQWLAELILAPGKSVFCSIQILNQSDEIHLFLT